MGIANEAMPVVIEITGREVYRGVNFRNARPDVLYIVNGERLYINDAPTFTAPRDGENPRKQAIETVNRLMFSGDEPVMAEWVVDLLRRYHVRHGRLPVVDEYENIS